MIGQCYSPSGKKYNIIILAGGKGTRIGESSNYIPKALSLLGNRRAIDYIIEKYINVAQRFTIGVGHHADLLVSYIKNHYSNIPITFVHENSDELKNNGHSTLCCLDYTDSNYGLIIAFCDLLMLGNNSIEDDSIFLATDKTKGNIGTFRHYVCTKQGVVLEAVNPIKPDSTMSGVLGTFIIGNTPLFKHIAYGVYDSITDLTWDMVVPYISKIEKINFKLCDSVYEFGTEQDLMLVRKLWEDTAK